VNAAAAASDILNTYDCSTPYRQKRCLVRAGQRPMPLATAPNMPCQLHFFAPYTAVR
jgi:hypothetical protein